MQEKWLQGEISISKPSNSNGEDYISIRLIDRQSRTEFLKIEADPKELMLALTGLAAQDVKFQLRFPERVGKVRDSVRLKKTVKLNELAALGYSGSAFDRAELFKYLREHCQEEGWFVDTYLGSQGSVGHTEVDGDKAVTLHYSKVRFVEQQ